MTSQHKTGTHPFYIGMYIHMYTHIYVHIYTSQKECLHIFSHRSVLYVFPKFHRFPDSQFTSLLPPDLEWQESAFENLLHGACVVVVPVMLLMVHIWGRSWSNCHHEILLPSKAVSKISNEKCEHVDMRSRNAEWNKPGFPSRSKYGTQCFSALLRSDLWRERGTGRWRMQCTQPWRQWKKSSWTNDMFPDCWTAAALGTPKAVLGVKGVQTCNRCGQGCWHWWRLVFQFEMVENLGAILKLRTAPIERLCAMLMCQWRKALKWTWKQTGQKQARNKSETTKLLPDSSCAHIAFQTYKYYES